MPTFPSENIPSVTFTDKASIAIDLTLEPWLSMFASLPVLDANNTEQYLSAFILGLESACTDKDAIVTSPVGRGYIPDNQSSLINRTDGTITEVQRRYQVAIALYLSDIAIDPLDAIAN